ncbi:MAG: LuxR C-terminal-related transcriptional regulator, partial [Spirochaetota bacterium]
VKAIRQRFTSVRCLVLSMHDENVYAERALKAGAMGYLMKHEAGKNVIESIRKIAAGEMCISETVSKKMVLSYVGGNKPGGSDPVMSLSDRELDVFRLIGEGKKTSEIAGGLGLSVSTVETYRANIKEKLKIKNSAALARFAVEWALADKG